MSYRREEIRQTGYTSPTSGTATDWKSVIETVKAMRSRDDDDDAPTFQYLVRGGVSVRQAAVADARSIARIASRAYLHVHGQFVNPDELVRHTARYEERALKEELGKPGVHFVLALWRGNPCGFARLRSFDGPIERSRNVPVEIEDLYVAPDWAGHGVGTALLQAGMTLSRERGYRFFCARVKEANNKVMHFLIEWGFAQSGREIAAPGRPGVVLFTRVLDEEDKTKNASELPREPLPVIIFG